MALSTIGGGDIAGRVEATIQRRGADGTPLSTAWTALAVGGAVLAVISLFSTWYAAQRTANALNSGWMPGIALSLIIAAGALLAARQIGLVSKRWSLSADVFTFGTLTIGFAVLLLNLFVKGDTVYILLLPLVASGYGLVQALENKLGAKLELEQVALGLAAMGGALIVMKISLDSEHLANGYVWGLIGAAAVVVAALAACQYLGILSIFQAALFVALAISTIILMVLITDVVTDGWPVLTERFGDFWSGTLRSRADDDRLGISQGIIGSFWIAVFVVVLAFPIGIAAAIYLEEYAPRNAFTNALDIVVRNLAGVPSVVYGLLGLFLFVKSAAIGNFLFGIVNGVMSGIFWLLELINITDGDFEGIEATAGQSSLLAGGVTLAILVLPIIIITAAEAVRSVPQSLREGAFGVGATKWEVIRSQVMPFAAPGILTGTLLALARAVGEAAPLILVGAITGRLAPRDSMFAGAEEFFGQFADRFTAMPIVIVGWVANSGRDEGFGPAAGAAIVVLLVFVILMNSVAVLLRNHFEKKRA